MNGYKKVVTSECLISSMTESLVSISKAESVGLA